LKRAVFVGGGAAGFFGGIAFAAQSPGAEAIILEKGPQFLQKVRISGGGRCNVTHALFEPREFARRYPRGERELNGLLQRFQPRDTVQWFEDRGVSLKIEPDGRMFPVTDSSQTIIDCLLREAQKLRVSLRANASVESIETHDAGFQLRLTGRQTLDANTVMLATGGARTPALGALAVGLGHSLVEPVPSLFTLQIESGWLRNLAGVSVADAQISTTIGSLKERGAILVTHWGLSGPAVLRLSAWGARPLHHVDYKFPVTINWLPAMAEEKIRNELMDRAKKQPAKYVVNWPLAPLPARLWEALVVEAAGISRVKRWTDLGRAGVHTLVQTLIRSEFQVNGKSLNKDEFVTCGGVKLSEVNLKTMESRIRPGLFFAGECLDIDGITGGFNFQAAWTTGWVAGNAMAEKIQTIHD
jgi:predicted Rossmann fold flavoprotein